METTELITTLGLDPEKIKSVDDFKTAIESDWVRKKEVEKDPAIIDPIVGKMFGAAEVNFLRELKSTLGVELPSEEIKGKKLSEIFKIAFPKVSEHYGIKISELEKKSGQGNDEKIKDWEKKYGDLEKKFTDHQGLHKATVDEFNNFKSNLESEKRAEKLTEHKNKIHSAIKWSANLKDTEHEGLKAIMDKSYKLSFDDKGNEEVFDASGNRIKSTKTAGSFKTYAEIYEEEAEKRGMIQKNDKKTGMGAGFNKPAESAASNQPLVVGGRLREINIAARDQHLASQQKK